MFSTRVKQSTIGSWPLTIALVAEAGAEAAVAEQHRGGAVAHHLGQARIQVDLEVEVRVDIEQAGHQPEPVDVDDCARRPRRQRRRRARRYGPSRTAMSMVCGASPLPSNTVALRSSTSQLASWHRIPR
jgi:hypothetical protein